MRGGEILPLDRPPLVSNIRLKNIDSIYSHQLPSKYITYMDIKTGNIQYWVSPQSKSVYNAPNFTLRTDVHPVVFVDPMGVVKPEYRRDPVKCTLQCDSYTRDSLVHREDLMERLLRKTDQTDWGFYN